MKSNILIVATLSLGQSLMCGCVTTSKTRGYQTNPPVSSGNGLGVQPTPNESGIQALWSKMMPSAPKRRPTALPKNDPTRLNSEAQVSADLLVVAGEMALERQAHDAAEDYFRRALGMDSQHMKANLGLAKIHEMAGHFKKAEKIYAQLRTWYPDDPELLHWLGAKDFDVPNPIPDVLAPAVPATARRVARSTRPRQKPIEVDNGKTIDAAALAMTSSIDFDGVQKAKTLSNPYHGQTDRVQQVSWEVDDVVDYRPNAPDRDLYHLHEFQRTAPSGANVLAQNSAAGKAASPIAAEIPIAKSLSDSPTAAIPATLPANIRSSRPTEIPDAPVVEAAATPTRVGSDHWNVDEFIEDSKWPVVVQKARPLQESSTRRSLSDD